MRSRAAVFLVSVFVSLLAASASAQSTPGRLTGLVTDTQGAILPGVTVTATSPSLIGGQTTVTQPDGNFFFPRCRLVNTNSCSSCPDSRS